MKKKINGKKLFSSNRFFYVVCVFFLLSFFIFGFSKIGDRIFINFNIFKLSAREEVKHDGCLDYIINTSESDKNIVKKVFLSLYGCADWIILINLSSGSLFFLSFFQ